MHSGNMSTELFNKIQSYLYTFDPLYIPTKAELAPYADVIAGQSDLMVQMHMVLEEINKTRTTKRDASSMLPFLLMLEKKFKVCQHAMRETTYVRITPDMHERTTSDVHVDDIIDTVVRDVADEMVYDLSRYTQFERWTTDEEEIFLQQLAAKKLTLPAFSPNGMLVFLATSDGSIEPFPTSKLVTTPRVNDLEWAETDRLLGKGTALFLYMKNAIKLVMYS